MMTCFKLWLQLEDIASMAERVVVPYRMQLYGVGESVAHVYIIYSGLFKARLRAEQQPCEVAIIGPGVVVDPAQSSRLVAAEFGATEEASSSDLLCESEQSVVYRLPRSELLKILQQSDSKGWDQWCTRRNSSWEEQQLQTSKRSVSLYQPENDDTQYDRMMSSGCTILRC